MSVLILIRMNIVGRSTQCFSVYIQENECMVENKSLKWLPLGKN